MNEFVTSADHPNPTFHKQVYLLFGLPFEHILDEVEVRAISFLSHQSKFAFNALYGGAYHLIVCKLY